MFNPFVRSEIIFHEISSFASFAKIPAIRYCDRTIVLYCVAVGVYCTCLLTVYYFLYRAVCMCSCCVSCSLLLCVSTKHGIKEHLGTETGSRAAGSASGVSGSVTVTVTCHLNTVLQVGKQATDEHLARSLVVLC